MIYISLCIPTNGISEWVFPVLDKIFCQDVDSSLYEVIVTNNGCNEAFHSEMEMYAKKYCNLIYEKTSAYLFENQIEALKLANGEFLKFLNHRSLLENGALEWMIDIVRKEMSEKPVIYLSNGAIGHRKRAEFNDFDGFVNGLKRYASWTTGVGVWRSDFENIPKDYKYNKISPHSDVLFFIRNSNRYIIDDTLWSKDIDENQKNKGKYDLYKAFGVEEISVTLGLYLDGDITAKTLKNVIKDYKRFVSECYCDFNIRRIECSYKIDGFEQAMGIFMNKREILFWAYLIALKRSILRIIKK